MNVSLLLYVQIYKHSTQGPNSEGNLHMLTLYTYNFWDSHRTRFFSHVCIQQLAQHLTHPTEKAAAKIIDKTECNDGSTEVIDIAD